MPVSVWSDHLSLGRKCEFREFIFGWLVGRSVCAWANSIPRSPFFLSLIKVCDL